MAADDVVRQLLTTPRVKIVAHADDLRWQVAYRIAVSGKLGRSRPLARFLLFIVDRHIRGRDEEITEQQIGMLIFDRPERYDSNEDNIVRSYARNLRRRIDEYYATEGSEEPLYLEIPRGGYTPLFTLRDLSAAKIPLHSKALEDLVEDRVNAPASEELPGRSDAPGVEPAPRTLSAVLQKSAAGRWLQHRYALIAAVCCGIVLGLTLAALRPHHHANQTGPWFTETASDGLWQQMFKSDRDTYVVPSDDGLVIMQRLTERPVPLASYISGTYRDTAAYKNDPAAAEIAKLGARRYTSVVDLDFVAHLTQVNAVDSARMMIRYARDLRMDDLRTGNAVLIGSIESNPWIQIFEPQMNFRQRISTDPGVASGFVNVHPQPGEKEIYGTSGNDHTYGLIAFLPNLNSTGSVLVVGGLNTAGTQAATTFLLNPSLMAPLLHDAKGSRGELLPFEVLISAGNFASNASSPQIRAQRINGH